MRTRTAMVLPLALAQFVASYAATTMNVAISAIAHDLGTTVIGVQTTITLFTLTMAALMVPGSKLTDSWGRKRCFVIGLVVYGAGALLAAFASGPGLLLLGYSLLEGIGSALMIPPIYILVTVSFTDPAVRARYFGVVGGAGALGAAVGPLLGGLVTSWLGWRASFLLQVAIVVWVVVAARHIVDQPRPQPRPRFDLRGAVLSSAGLFFVVFGVLRTGTYGWLVARADFAIGDLVLLPAGGLSPVWVFVGIGVLVLYGFFRHIKSAPDPLCSPRLFRDRTSNLGLGTQTAQWLVMQGAFFVVSVYLQQERGLSAVQTGLVLLPATVGVLTASGAAQRMARRHPARRLVIAGFAASAVGQALLLLPARDDSTVLLFAPGLFLLGAGVGTMLTASVNLVQSAWPDRLQGDISGVSRAVSNLGSSLGTALAGSVLAGAAAPGGRPFAAALVVLVGFALLGLVIALLVPRRRNQGGDRGA